MSDVPETLQLADVLEMSSNHGIRRKAADELRRLHEAHGWQYRMAGERLRRVEKLEAQRDALLEALKNIDKEFRKYGRQHWPESVKARAAIAKVEGQQ